MSAGKGQPMTYWIFVLLTPWLQDITSFGHSHRSFTPEICGKRWNIVSTVRWERTIETNVILEYVRINAFCVKITLQAHVNRKTDDVPLLSIFNSLNSSDLTTSNEKDM
jgi:hypothetical protein